MRTIRIGGFEFFGSERRQSDSMTEVLIPRLERQYGTNHRLVRAARRRAEELREAELARLSAAIRNMAW
jgi:hypothetical protein